MHTISSSEDSYNSKKAAKLVIMHTTKGVKVSHFHHSYKTYNKGSFMRFCAGRMSLGLQTLVAILPKSQQSGDA